MRSALVLVAVACGSSSPNQPAPASPGPTTASPSPPAASPSPPTKAGRAITAEAFCERFTKLTRECEPFARSGVATDTCIADTRAMLAHEHPSPQAMALIRCVVEGDGCDDTLQCLALDLEDPAAKDAAQRACNDHSRDGMHRVVGIPRSEWVQRNGAGVSTYRAIKSTKAAPIEMCGVSAANLWLTTLRCDDSSRPIGDPHEAERTRVGNVGPGGRCGSIIDHYLIRCPEASYDVFIDAYVCPRPD